jgi:hypothetical protein
MRRTRVSRKLVLQYVVQLKVDLGDHMNCLLFSRKNCAISSGSRIGLLSRILAFFTAAALTLLVSGCAVSWVGNYDKESVERTTEISKSVLKLYQNLIATPFEGRASAVAGPLATAYGDVESQIRLHLLREQARAKNTESSKIAENLLESWQKFAANHRSADASALNGAVLNIERGILERHLRAAFVAEEAKKVGSSAAT